MKRILLDTNAYSLYSNGNTQVREVMIEASGVFVSTISIGELYFGFKAGIKESENIRILGAFVRDPKVEIVDVSPKTAVYYSNIKYTLRKKGTPIPDNDAWIAASALETKSTVITFDRHFLKVPKIKVWDVLQ